MALHAPFGTDEQPSVNVKIVAGKALEVKGRNGGKNDSLSRTPYKYSSRPPWFLDDFSGETKKSNKPLLASILPSSNTCREERVLAGPQPREVKGKTSKQDNPEESVDFMLSRLLSQFPASKFKEIYTEMAGFDPRLTSYVTKHQVEMTLKRHKTPIPSTVLHFLLEKFASEHNVDVINYENLIKYLFSYSLKGSSLMAVAHERKPSSEIKNDNIISKAVSPRSVLSDSTSSPRSDQSSYVSPRSLVKKAMDDREEAYLLVQIEQAFKTNGAQILATLTQLHNDLRKLGNGTEHVRADQIERTCSWLRLPLHHSLLEKILNRFDIKKNGKINWIEFVGFLEKGVPLSIQQSSHASEKGKSSLPFWESQVPLAPVSPRKQIEQQKSIAATKGKRDENLIENERKKIDVALTDVDNGPLENLERHYDILKVGRNNDSSETVHVMQFDPADDAKPLSTDSERNAETLDEKLERFSHLTAALLRSDVDKDGTLKARDVLRIVNNYNLIYNLHLPEEKVLEVTQRCTVSNTHDVVIDELARSLWELIKTV